MSNDNAASSPCTHDPRQYAGEPLGMYHCPECGEMVVAGMAHPEPIDWSEVADPGFVDIAPSEDFQPARDFDAGGYKTALRGS